MKKTVRDFMKHVLPRNSSEEDAIIFFENERQADFWRKLCRLGSIKATKNPEECDDIDATAPLTDKEWADLEVEFSAL